MKLMVFKSTLSFAAVLVASIASAAPLAPSKPSQLVDLQPTIGAVCPYNSNAAVVDTVLKPDGTTERLTIPQGQVLVVTAVEFNNSLLASGHRYQFVLFRTNSPGTFAPITSANGVSVGAAHAAVTIPHGSSVKAGTQLCAATLDFTNATVTSAGATVHGFLTRDR